MRDERLPLWGKGKRILDFRPYFSYREKDMMMYHISELSCNNTEFHIRAFQDQSKQTMPVNKY